MQKTKYEVTDACIYDIQNISDHKSLRLLLEKHFPDAFKESDYVPRPPLGIMPEYIWKQRRMEEVHDAIWRYNAQEKTVPQEWKDEYSTIRYWLDDWYSHHPRKFIVEDSPLIYKQPDGTLSTSKPNMKPFDLKLAVNGSPVITSKGHEVKIAGYNPHAKVKARVVGWVSLDEQSPEARAWSDTGEAAGDDGFNLFMAPLRKSGYINLYPKYVTDESKVHYRHGRVYGSRDEAIENELSGSELIATIKIEWEE